MKEITYLFVALSLVSMSVCASAQTYHKSISGWESDIHGEWSEELKQILKRADRDPEALRDLAPLPLEQTYKALLERRSPNTPAYAPMRELARKILYEHPDLENYLSRHLRRMAELLEPVKPRDYDYPEGREKREQRDIAADYIVGYIHFAATLEGDGAFRLLGPRLFDRTWEADYGDVIAQSHSHFAKDHLRSLIRKRLPGERVPANLDEMKVWWKANEQRFAVKPKTVATAVVVEPRATDPPAQPTSRPRIPLAKAAPEQKTQPPPASNPGNTLQILGALAGLAIVVELVRRFRPRK